MNAPDVRTAEQLWIRAHEFVRRGEFANAVRDLASAYQILQQLADPRLPEVHRRWIEVHQMYLEDGARNDKREPEQKAQSLQAEAEAAANQGQIEKAIGLYEQVVAASTDDELARERLDELRAAKRRADELSGSARAAAPAAAAQAKVGADPKTLSGLAEDDWSGVAGTSDEGAAVAEAAAPVAGISATDDRWGAPAAKPAAQPAAAQPVVGLSATDPRWGAPATGPTAASAGKPAPAMGDVDVGAQVARLESMLARIHERRRA